MELAELCQPCTRINKESVSKNWCMYCEERLCQSCETAHRLNKLTFAHHFIPKKPTRIITSLEKKRQIKLSEYTNIFGMTISENGTLMVSVTEGSSYNYVLLLIDKEDSIKRCPITNTGINIANIPGMNRAVLTTYHHNSDSIIQFIDTESLNIGKQVLIADDRQYFSITIIKDKIYLGSAEDIKICNTEGKHLETIEIQTVNGGMFRLQHDRSGNLYYTDDKYMAKINQKGQHFFCYKKNCFTNVCGCLLDHNEYIYVGGKNYAHFIMHQLLPDGMLVNDAFCDEDIKDPTAMCFNNDFTELYVADDSTGSIFVFDCKSEI